MAVVQRGLFEELDNIFGQYRNKRVTVLHSGGLDSNIILAGLYFAGADVNAVAIRAKVLASATIEERTRQLFIKRLKESNKGKGSITSETITFDGSLQGIHRNRFSQMAIWLNMLPLVSRENDDAVILGYVMSDQGNTMIDYLKKTWRTHAPFLKWGAKLPSLDFPVTRFAKPELIKYLQHKCKEVGVDENIVHIHWFCELQLGSIMNRCENRCESCKRAKNENLFDWDIATNVRRVFRTRLELMEFLELDRDNESLRMKKNKDGSVETYIVDKNTDKQRLVYTTRKLDACYYTHPEEISMPKKSSPYDHFEHAGTDWFPEPSFFPEYYLELDEDIKAREIMEKETHELAES